MWWHTVTHWRGSEEETVEWSGKPVLFTLPRNMLYPALLPLMRTPRLPAVDWTDTPPADLNVLVSFAERRNLVSARVPSHCKRSLLSMPLSFVHRAAICVQAVKLHAFTQTHSNKSSPLVHLSSNNELWARVANSVFPSPTSPHHVVRCRLSGERDTPLVTPAHSSQVDEWSPHRLYS